MIKVHLYPSKKSPSDMIELIRAKTGKPPFRVERAKSWLLANNISAEIINNMEIDFEHEEDAVMFKLMYDIGSK